MLRRESTEDSFLLKRKWKLKSTITVHYHDAVQLLKKEREWLGCVGARKITAFSKPEHKDLFFSIKQVIVLINYYIIKSHCTHTKALWWLELELLVLFLWLLFSVKGCKFSQSTSIISGSSTKGENMTLYYSQKTAAQREKEKSFYEFWCQMFSKVPVHLCVSLCGFVCACVWLCVYIG